MEARLDSNNTRFLIPSQEWNSGIIIKNLILKLFIFTTEKIDIWVFGNLVKWYHSLRESPLFIDVESSTSTSKCTGNRCMETQFQEICLKRSSWKKSEYSFVVLFYKIKDSAYIFYARSWKIILSFHINVFIALKTLILDIMWLI